jgi:hypothetical protein
MLDRRIIGDGRRIIVDKRDGKAVMISGQCREHEHAARKEDSGRGWLLARGFSAHRDSLKTVFWRMGKRIVSDAQVVLRLATRRFSGISAHGFSLCPARSSWSDG